MIETNSEQYINQIINEEYKIWKKHVPFLYNILQNFEITTCSNTIQWLQQKQIEQQYVVYKCLIGTNNLERNQLSILKVQVPSNNVQCDMSEYKLQASLGELGLHKAQVCRSIPQNSEVMRARINPCKQELVASKCGGANPQINLFNISSEDNDNNDPILRLEGHTAQGFGLDWNTKRENYILSGSMDRKICLWDIESSRQIDYSLKPLQQYLFHSMGVEDVVWNKFNPDIFATCGQDKLVAIWDLREKRKKPEIQKTAHTSEIYTLDFSPFSENMLLSGGEDAEIGLWDLRNIQKRILTFIGHSQSVNKISWSPHNKLLFVSGSSDRRSVVWDISKCGEMNQNKEPAEIVFIHAGHRTRLCDIDWSPQPMMIGSTEQSNSLQCWRMADSISEEYMQ